MLQIFKLELPAQDVEVISKALAAMPLGEAFNTFMRFQTQVAAQNTEAPKPGAAPPVAAPIAPPVPNGQDTGGQPSS